jgi:hypothetical protein
MNYTYDELARLIDHSLLNPTITRHIPDKGFQMVRYYGWYSNRARGERANRGELPSACRRGPSRPAPSPHPGESLTRGPVSRIVHSEIGGATWPSSRVVREFLKANSYWLPVALP